MKGLGREPGKTGAKFVLSERSPRRAEGGDAVFDRKRERIGSPSRFEEKLAE